MKDTVLKILTDLVSLQVTIGEHDLSQTGETTIPEKKVAVASYVNHEDYSKPNTYSNDITVIELAEELDLTVYIPACLAQTGDTTAFDGEDKNFLSKLSLSGHTTESVA